MFYYRTKRSLTILSLFAFAFALMSCESEKPTAAFYPVDSLISGQIAHLVNIKAGLYKEALLDGKNDSLTYTPKDTLQWEKELEAFRKLDDINKPINKENYTISEGRLDRESNLTVKAFEARRDLPIVYLKIYYQGSIEKPRKIEAMYDEENLLFQNARLLSMRFEQIGSKTILTSYSVKGGQKMMFGDSVTFYISGRILVD